MKSIVSFLLSIIAIIIQIIELVIAYIIFWFVVGWVGRLIGFEDIYYSLGSSIKEMSAGGLGTVAFALIFVFYALKTDTKIAKFHNDIVDKIISKIFKD